MCNVFLTGEANKVINDYKYRLQKAEQEIASLQASLARSETQVIRYKSTAEAAEKAEADLKLERRKLQREVSTNAMIIALAQYFIISHFFFYSLDDNLNCSRCLLIYGMNAIASDPISIPLKIFILKNGLKLLLNLLYTVESD